MRGMKEEERGRKMDRESDDFKERGEERGERVLVNGQYKLKPIMCVSHYTRTSVTIDWCHLIMFAATPPHNCAGNLCPYRKFL